MSLNTVKKYATTSCWQCLELGEPCYQCRAGQVWLEQQRWFQGQESPFKPAKASKWASVAILTVLSVASLSVLLMGLAVSAL